MISTDRIVQTVEPLAIPSVTLNPACVSKSRTRVEYAAFVDTVRKNMELKHTKKCTACGAVATCAIMYNSHGRSIEGVWQCTKCTNAMRERVSFKQLMRAFLLQHKLHVLDSVLDPEAL